MTARIEEMQSHARQVCKPFDEMLLLVDHRRLVQWPDGNGQVAGPRLADGLEQVLVTAIQMLSK
ncbi:hypothetical protein D3C71_2194720 [compost metagenome]